MFKYSRTGLRYLFRPSCFLLMGASVAAAQIPELGQSDGPYENKVYTLRPSSLNGSSCEARRVNTLPGSKLFASQFIETLATDLSSASEDRLWALTADLNDDLPPQQRAMYISLSKDNGQTWTAVTRIDDRYFNASIGEGLRNSLVVLSRGNSFVITTQQGAFEVIPQSPSLSAVAPLAGPVTPEDTPRLPRTKAPGEPVRANIASISSNGQDLYVGYGYFDRAPRIFHYRRDHANQWQPIEELRRIPTEMDLLSAELESTPNGEPATLYAGTGDQAFALDLQTGIWRQIQGVGPDSAIHAMTLTSGLHLAACWGLYRPLWPLVEERITDAQFLVHRYSDQTGPNIRAYSYQIDPAEPLHQVAAALTGVYISVDGGDAWSRLNTIPDGEYRTAHFTGGGKLLLSGMPGTFLVDAFSGNCVPALQRR